MDIPETRYARSGDVSIAYQVVGDGPFDLVFVPGFVSHVDLIWENPRLARFFSAFAEFSRLIVFDKRGTGASDRVTDIPDLETRMDDVRAVMDAADSKRAAVFGLSEGGPMSVLFAATYPERTHALVLYGTYARHAWAPDYPWRPKREDTLGGLSEYERTWGTPAHAAFFVEPSDQDDPEELARAARMLRSMATPSAVAALTRMNVDLDVRAVLPSIRVPTLVVHRTEDHIDVENGRFLAREIPGARYVEFPGGPHLAALGDWQSVVDATRDFLVPLCTDVEDAVEPEVVLATVLFTDIVDSTARAARLGDRAWRGVLEQHNGVVRRELARFRGREHDTAGDGFFASFDGPARAIRCASAIRDALHDIDVDIRAGLHTGECEVLENKVSGIAVAIGARVAARAQRGEVLVSQTVRDLVAGSGLSFEERGAAELKGVPGEWRLYAVADAAS